jgi:hypothetical protein
MFLLSFMFLFGSGNPAVSPSEFVSKGSLINERTNQAAEIKGFNRWLFSDPETDPDEISYKAIKANIGELRLRLRDELKQGQIPFDSIKAAFTAHLVDKIIPHWYGTPWSFGGHTAVPNEGEIACGYFISTTLRDMGLKLNRYKLAQKSPIDEAKVISCGSAIYNISEASPEKAIEEIDRLTREGLHFIGFDTGHVGYLLKREGEMFLIHSNYLTPYSVCIEPLKESSVFKSFSKFHLVDISNNEVLLKRWLEDTVVL